jgi:hypothetical protein
VSIYLNNIRLPDGLRFSDEFKGSPIAQTIIHSLTGAPIVQQGEKLAGRPITLIGGNEFAWLTRAETTALKALLDTGAEMTLTLHDAREFTVLPADDDPLAVSAVPIVRDSGPADPSAGAWYVLESLKLIEV